MANKCRRLVVPIALVMLLLVPSSVLAASATIVHMSYAGHATEWSQWLKYMAERFEEKTGIHVDIEVGPNGDAYREQVMVRTAAGIAPDVTDFNPLVGAILVNEKVFEDLRPYVAKSHIDLSQYPPVGIQGMTAPDGTMWGFAVSILPIPVYFNADMFSKAGLRNPKELGDGWTWDAYLKSARKLTIRNSDGKPVQFGTIDTRFRWEQLIHQAGGRVYDRFVFPTQSRFNSPEVLAAFKFREQLYNDGLIATTGGVWAGNTAITTIDPPTIINKYKGGFEMDVAMQPKGPGGRGGVVNPDGFQIHGDSKHKEEAWKWINYLISDKDGLAEFTRLTGRLPALKEVMLRYDKISRDRLPGNWYALIQSAFSADAYPPYMIQDASITAAVNTGLNSIWSGKVAPEVALQQIHEQVTALLAAHKAR